MLRPGFRVRWYRPSRSTTSIRCCCTTRTDFESVMITSRTRPTARMMRNILVPVNSLSPDERRCALDLDDADEDASVDDLRGIVGPRLPVLPADLHHAAPL